MPETAAGAAWRRLALDPPRAFGAPPVTGEIRAAPEDFTVEERLGYEPDGGRAHRLLWVEKRAANTLDVARELAAAAGCHPAEVGFAGMKDRRAVARQWFTVPAERGQPPPAGYAGSGFRVLASHAHSRKLRRGALAGNAFAIRVRDAAGDPTRLAAGLERLAAVGFPNYFGPQRFGVDGANLERVRAWLGDGRLPRGREARAFLLSTARSIAFQAVLAWRVADGSWSSLLPGEVVNLAGSASVFVAAEPDPGLAQRCREGDLGPTGPLCGAGGLAPVAEAAVVEQSALEEVAPIPERLAAAGMRAERRALVARPASLRHRREGGTLLLEFALPRGAYATSLLRELVATAAPVEGLE
ncbi:MAG TPA: tRNA pseudouridine(13) synthase TruD [Steroidobacteraceae bacterium]|nr:tRNA pseudouridine(13) synthase TruD [Steroidobacteraceae bacterium]